MSPLSLRRTVPAPPTTPAALQEGKAISDQYVVERVIGKMGSCVLVKVRHARLGQRFMLKHLSSETARRPEASEQFLASARSAMKIQSEHVVRTVDAGRLASGLPYVVTEAFQGSELREILRVRGALGLNEAVDFILQAAEAVAEAHRHGLIHGSLNPSTLFVTRRPDGRPCIKVLEFGSADTLRGDPLALRLRSWEHGTAAFWESNRLWDTLAYSAPEQVRGANEPTPLSDVWALGATLHELLSGSAAFRAESATALLAAIVADAPTPLSACRSDMPLELEGVVLRCLSKEPSARFPAVAELAAALRPFASPENQLAVERIARIQSHEQQQQPLSSSTRAIVRVGPSPAPASAAPQARARGTAPAFVFRPVLTMLLVGAGVMAGTIGGAFVARHAFPRNEGAEPLLRAAQARPVVQVRAAVTPAASSLPVPAKVLAQRPPERSMPERSAIKAAPTPAASSASAASEKPAPKDLFDQMW